MGDLYLSKKQDYRSALIVVDQQLDFEPGGALPVEEGDIIVDGIIELMDRFTTVILTQDAHPQGHISFASSYEGKRPYDVLSIEEVWAGKVKGKFSNEVLEKYLASVPGRRQVLWPDHCIPGTEGQLLDQRLPSEEAELILRKGTRLDCDSYSIFRENDGTSTGLAGYLQERGIDTIYMAGLTADYCVNWSVNDAIDLGFKAVVLTELTKYVDRSPASVNAVLRTWKERGIQTESGIISYGSFPSASH